MSTPADKQVRDSRNPHRSIAEATQPLPVRPPGWGRHRSCAGQDSLPFTVTWGARVALAGLCAALGCGGALRAAEVIKAPTGTDLVDGASWGGAVPPTAADTAVWQPSSLGAGLSLATPASWGGIRINGAMSAIDISGIGGITLGSGGIDASNSGLPLTIANPILANAPQNWATSSSMTFTGPISGTQPLQFDGTSQTSQTYSTAFLTPTAAVIFPNTPLAGVASANGLMDGAYVQGTNVPALGYKFENNGTTATFQLRFFDGGYTKCVKVELTQVGADIHGRAVYAKYYNSNGTNDLTIDFDGTAAPIANGTIATSAGAAGYGVASLTILIGTKSTITLAGFSPHSGGMIFTGGDVFAGNGVAVEQSQGGSLGTGSVTLQPGTRLTTTGVRVLGGGNITTRTVTIHSAVADITAAGPGGEYLRTLNLTGGLVTATAGTPWFRVPNGGCDITSAAAPTSSAITTGIDMTFGNLAFDVADGAAVTDLEVSGIITQNTGAGSGAKSITKQGPGTLFLTRANTFTGGVIVQAGIVTVGNANSLGAFLTDRPASQITVAAGGAIDFRGVGNATYGYNIAGTGVGGSGALTNSGGAIATGLAQCSNITLNAPASIGGAGSWALLTNSYNPTTLDLQGHTLTKTGANTIALVTTSVTAGTIQVAEGTLAFGVTNGGSGVNAAAAALVLANTPGATLSLVRASSVGSLAGGGGSGGNVALGANTLTVGGLGTDTGYDGVISGTGGLTKVGAGTLVLAAHQSYTGATTVSAGTLAPSGSLAGALMVQSGGTVSPGGASLASVTVAGDVTLAGTFACQLHKAGATLTQDRLATPGAAALGGTLAVTATGDTLAAGDSFQIIDADSYSGSFASFILPALPAGLSWDIDSLATNGTLAVSTRVTTPFFTPSSGAYVGTPQVTITSDPAATIYYTTDGSTPTTFSTPYTGPITLPSNVEGYQIKTLATKPGQSNSNIGSATYNTTDIPSWNEDANGDWSDASKWLRGVIPDQSGVTANFTFTQSADTQVTLDGNRTVGGLIFGNANPFNWEILPSGGSVLTLQTPSGAPSVQVTNNAATLTTALAGTQGFTRTGAGTLVLPSANSLTGTVTLDDGITAVRNNGGLGSAEIVIGTGTQPVALYVGNRADITNPITVSADGSGTVTLGGENTGGGANATSFLGPVTLNRPTTFSGEITEDRLSFDGKISGNVGTLTLTGGSRTTLISPDNDFFGDILVTGAGTILQSGANTTPETIPNTTSVTVDAGAFFQITPSGAGTETINALMGSGTVRSFPTAALPATLAVGGAGGDGIFNGSIINGMSPLSLTKAGGGTQTLAGTNEYTGPTRVSQGTLVVNGSLAAGSAVTVDPAGTLAGIGTVAGPVTAAGALAPGTSVGTLTLGNTILTGTYRCEIDGPSADLLATGTLNLTGATLAVTHINPGTAFPYTIATYTPGGLTGTFASVTPGYTVDYSVDGQITLDKGTGGYAEWAAANAPGQTMDQDHDGDSTPNGIEFFMGEIGSGFTLRPTLDDNNTVSYPRAATYAGIYGTDYVVQTSTSLSGWDDVPETDPDLDLTGPVTYKLPAGGGKNFVRLKVMGPP